VEVRGTSRGGPVELRRSGSSIEVVPGQSRGRARSVDATLRVPRWMDLEIGSRSLDLAVSGLAGGIRVGNVAGDVRIQDVDGPVDVRSVRGEIVVIDARGGVRASSQADDVTLVRMSGSVEAHTGDGDIVLQDLRSEAVRVEALDGDVTFSGTIAPGGNTPSSSTTETPPSPCPRRRARGERVHFRRRLPVGVHGARGALQVGPWARVHARGGGRAYESRCSTERSVFCDDGEGAG
jgi:hypothetical protein